MLIDAVLPNVIGGRSSLTNLLKDEANRRGKSEEYVKDIISVIPEALVAAGCFFDRLTGYWRYEFGEYTTLNALQNVLWGTHMWCRVDVLFLVLTCASERLTLEDRARYLQRLANPSKHQDALAEMYPVLRVASSVPVFFEVVGRADGNRTIDWLIEPPSGRPVLIEVKRRMADVIEAMDRVDLVKPPRHDPALLFRSLESKFLPAHTRNVLQGAWIVTDVKQSEKELKRAFNNLDPDKVHFYVLGDTRRDVYIFTRSDNDKTYIKNTFNIIDSRRFTY